MYQHDEEEEVWSIRCVCGVYGIAVKLGKVSKLSFSTPHYSSVMVPKDFLPTYTEKCDGRSKKMLLLLLIICI